MDPASNYQPPPKRKTQREECPSRLVSFSLIEFTLTPSLTPHQQPAYDVSRRGKFYEWDDKNKDTTADAVNAVTVAPGETGLVASCGKSDAASGTEGYLDLYDGDTKICTVYWSVPWGSKYNTFTIQDRNPGYLISVSDWNQSHGGIGKVELEIAKKS